FQANLKRMTRLAARSGVPLILVNPVTNLKDCPPFKIESSAELSGDDRARFNANLQQARQIQDDLPEEIRLVREALALDGRHGGAWFHLGKCLEEAGRFTEAKAAYIRAKEEDVCPLRCLEEMHEIILETAKRSAAGFVDARVLFEELSENGMPGEPHLVDHVHPGIHGHQLLADALMEELIRLKIARPTGDWRTLRDVRRREHLASLDYKYFVRGKERLGGLLRWTKGRGDRIRPTDNKTN
ncbi:MAG: hypothetical protein N2C14_30925, partial [Planctomycetales bacterium]